MVFSLFFLSNPISSNEFLIEWTTTRIGGGLTEETEEETEEDSLGVTTMTQSAIKDADFEGFLPDWE